MQNLVYKTFELNTDVEHKAKPINISGATTIRLTNIPSNVKCWISTESNGTNLYPLINRGDGWSNLPNPLYNLYIYTEGTTIDNEKIILNYTGQNDFFIYGNNSSERIDRIGAIDSFSDKSIIQLNNAIFNTFSLVKPIFQTKIMGEYKLGRRNWAGRVAILPNGINWNIGDLKLDDDEYYRIRLFGHFDLGGTNPELDSSESGAVGNSLIKFKLEHTAHLCIFKNDNNAKFSAWDYAGLGADIEFPAGQFFLLDKEPYANKLGVFDLYGLKYESFFYFQHTDTGNGAWSHDTLHTLQDTGLNINCNDFIIKGSELNSYNKIGILCTSNLSGNNDSQKPNPSLHCSLILTISKAYSDLLGV